jgi:hypothetical protein
LPFKDTTDGLDEGEAGGPEEDFTKVIALGLHQHSYRKFKQTPN